MGCFNLRSLLLAVFVISNCITWTASRHYFTHNASGHRSRHRRQGAGLYLPASYVVPGGADAGAWGEWGEVSPCSRTCGGGVASQKRICLEIAPDGRPMCTGGDTKYFSCQTQDCPADAGDFRSEQCSAYNDVPFKNSKYTWIPYTNGPNQCELNCMPKGERFYYRHKSKVIDGTRCNDESFDVCVDGTCQPVGCDMMLGSNAREDKCRECRGNGTHCYTSKGRIDTTDLRKGYNDILLIPEGATSIIIEEIKDSSNYLALRAKQDNVYYLNGDYHIDFPRTLIIAGAPWHYERSQQGFAAPDKLRCMGPTTEPLYLSLLLQDENVGIDYEYSIPTALAPPPNAQYVWVHDDFTPCSATCGGGFQTRTVTCRSREALDVVDDSLCDSGLRPPSNETCNLQACAATWVEGPWSPCTKPCGQGGTRSRQIHCQKIISNGVTFSYPSIVEDQQCFELLGPKPELFQKCNVNASCPTWFTGPWKPCDKLCGEGKQTRQVVCHQRTGGRVEVLAEDQCADVRPPEEQSCMLSPCDGVDWVVSEWSGCDTCLSTVKTRVAECSTKDSELVDPKFCANHPKPELQQPCKAEDLPPCQMQWYATQWSNCSVECGKGVKTRRVFCGQFDAVSIRVVDDSKCDSETRYNDSTPCEIPKEKCPAKWFAGPWTECTKPCGAGEQYRKTMCLNAGKESLACAEEDTPDAMQTCNTGPCDSDETLPVNAMSTPVMDDDYEDCVDEDEEGEGEEVGAEVSPGELDEELMSSDAPYSTSSEGSGEKESEFTADTGSGTGSTWTTDEGSSEYTDETTETGDTGSTPETPETVTDVTGSDLTEETSSTVSGETESEVTEESGATDATSSTDVTPTDSSVETESGASTVSPGSTETDITETTESGATEETSESSATESSVSEGSTDTTTENTSETETDESGSTVTEETATSVTEETGATETEVTVSTVTDETGSTVTEETDTTVTENTSSTGTEETVSTENTPTATEETVSTENSPSTTEETVSTEISPTATDGTVSTESSPSTTDSSSAITDTSTTETSDSSSSSDVTGTSDSSTTASSDLSTTEGLTPSESSTESTDATSSSDITGSTDSTVTEETTTAGTEATTGTSEQVTTESAPTGSTETTETEVTSSTESEGSTVSELTSESGSTTEQSTESEPTTVSGLTSESEPTESTVSGETEETGSPAESGSTTEFTEETSESSNTTPWDWSSTVAIYTNKPHCRPRKGPAKCIKSMFGCCPDGKTPAAGPFDEACPHPKTCNETKFGCCSDGVSPAHGLHNKGCPSNKCNETLYGCCKSDNKTPAEGNDQEGCPPPPPACRSSPHGCCKDGKTQATGPHKAGCPETTTEAPKTTKPVGCGATEFGCCYDNETQASGPDGQGCPCNATEFGCCPDGVTPAASAQMEGCVKSCNTSAHGCCPDGKTQAHGPDSEGCCLLYPYGCCPDNYKPADGPHLEGCGCQNARFGCCPDNVTIARGYDNEGCGCEHTQHGCCPDKHTEASGPSYEGCTCHTYQFGCCPDGISVAKGPNLQGCDCRQSTHGCCGDGQTAATGPDQAGCDCASSKYGCCPDGQTEAKGEKFSGCTDVPENKQAACSLPDVQGPCHNYSAYWFFDTQYGGCSRFWYGGCEGNGNRFATKEECEDVCVRPSDKEVCRLPKSTGGCGDAYQRWYYDSEYEQCGQFQYSGCLGNANNFETREKCQKQCQPDRNEDQCKLPIERGSCAGNFARWGFNAEGGRCEQFAWGGCEGNANRFSSEAACMLRCQPPGALQPECTMPQEAGNCTDKEPAWSFSETENRCVPFYYSGCGGNGNRFSDERSCAETCPSAFEQEMCTLPAEAGDCANYRINWYFDTATQRCRQFYYGGCGGNDNNFESEQLCQASCAGAPATTTTQRPAEAEPFREEYCFLEKNPGPCSGNETRWVYSAGVGDCQPFVYGGCEGNRNNFPSREYCLYYCKPIQDLCQLPMRMGRCSESLPRWFYDASTDRCSQFAYSGCDGNDNNFESAEYCERRCRSTTAPAPTSGPTLTTTTPVPQQIPAECAVSGLERCAGGRVWLHRPETGVCESYDPTEREGSCDATGVFPSPEACERACGIFKNLEVCRYSVDAGSCTGAEIKFYYDQATHACQQFTYSGCYGGPNRFSTIDECESICMPETDPCKQPAEAGNCLEYHAMWYYDEARDDCNQFYWTGCGGNSNRFATQEECLGNCQRHPQELTTTSTPRPAPTALTPVVNEECRTPQSLEPCGVEQRAFYFNSESGACAAAMIGACRYSNSYRTAEECERQCGAFRGQDVCRTPLNPGPCRAAIPKVYWDIAEGRCRQFTYGGCSGGPNRFSTVDECNEVCGHLAIDAACRLAVASGAACAGASAAGVPRWYHSSLHGECREFIFLGCAGNHNNFRTKQECERHCLPPDDDSENEIIPPVDCRAAEAECSAQRCQYGQVVASGDDGCRHCQCAPAPQPDCERARAECAALQCPRGVNRTRDSDGCESCSCIQEAPRRHPCAGVNCPEGQRCAATPYRDPITQEARYATECRLENKPGLCPADPTPSDSCSPEDQRQWQCRVDPDCRGAAKCCRVGCSQRCLEPDAPASPTAAPATAPPTTVPTSPPYVPEAPHAPVASPETQLNVSSAEGGVATLRCLFHSNPPPKITWRFGQITIDGTSGRYRLTSDGALEIVSLYRDDAGVYICIAENDLGTAQQEIRLEVTGPVTSAAGIAGDSRASVVGELGRPLSIRCLAYGYPQPSIAWYHGPGSDMVPYDSKVYEARDNVLLIRSLDVDSLGEYVCQVYNGVTKPASLTVEVWAYQRGGEPSSPYLLPRGDVVVVTPRAPPPDPTLPTTQSIVEFPDVPIYTAPVRTEIRAEQTTLSAGAELNLPCEVDGHPEPDVYWTKDGVQLQSGDRVQATSARLTVNSVTVNDSGVYGCHASNGHSQHSSTVQINVQGLYIPPQCTDNPFFANCALIVRSKYCNHKYYSAFCCKSCVEAGYLNPHALTLQADQSWMNRKK